MNPHNAAYRRRIAELERELVNAIVKRIDNDPVRFFSPVTGAVAAIEAACLPADHEHMIQIKPGQTVTKHLMRFENFPPISEPL